MVPFVPCHGFRGLYFLCFYFPFLTRMRVKGLEFAICHLPFAICHLPLHENPTVSELERSGFDSAKAGAEERSIRRS